jgi:hypothetical protein
MNATAPGYMATGITTTLRNDPVRSSQILERIQQAAGASRTMSLVRFGKQSWNDHQRGGNVKCNHISNLVRQKRVSLLTLALPSLGGEKKWAPSPSVTSMAS